MQFLPRSKQKPSVAADVACKTVSSLFAVMTTMVGCYGEISYTINLAYFCSNHSILILSIFDVRLGGDV